MPPKKKTQDSAPLRVVTGEDAERLRNEDTEEVQAIQDQRGPSFQILETLTVVKGDTEAVINVEDVEKWKARGWSPKN